MWVHTLAVDVVESAELPGKFFQKGRPFATCTSVKIIRALLRRLIATTYCSIYVVRALVLDYLLFLKHHVGLCKFVHYFVEVSVLVC